MKWALLIVAGLFLFGCQQTQVAAPKELAMPYPPLPVLAPSALTADAGNGRAYLRWNLQMEDPRVVAWHVIELAPERKTLTARPLTQPEFVVRGLSNGTACTFAVVGLLKDGTLTPQSNLVTVTPRDTGTAKVSGLDGNAKLSVGAAKDVPLGRWAVRITFPDGQELVYDRLRPVDWKTRSGEHLLYPVHFGNGLDVGRFDPRGLPRIIPPGGLQRTALDMRGDVLSADAAAFTYHDPQGGAWSAAGGAFTYHDLQFGYRHPHLTDPLTFSLDQKLHGDARVQWFEPQVDGDRVTVHWWQPMAMAGYTSWQWVQVWETWWPLERDRHGTKYHGLARLVEVQVPDAWKSGFQVMLNNGFGPGGSREGLVSYNTGFRKPGQEVVDFSGDKNKQVFFQHAKLPRAGSGYHSNMDCLQSSPLIFYDWGTGSLTIAARSLYYHCTNNSTSYIERGRRRRLAEPGLGPRRRPAANGGRYGRVPVRPRHEPALAATVRQRPVRGARRRVAADGRPGRPGGRLRRRVARPGEERRRPRGPRRETLFRLRGRRRRRRPHVPRLLARRPRDGRRRLSPGRDARLQPGDQRLLRRVPQGRLPRGILVPARGSPRRASSRPSAVRCRPPRCITATIIVQYPDAVALLKAARHAARSAIIRTGSAARSTAGRRSGRRTSGFR